MSQRFKVLVCDRDFKCPVCSNQFTIGDEIILLLPQRTRYCSPCGRKAVERKNGSTEDMPPIRDAFGGPASGGPVTTRPMMQPATPYGEPVLNNYVTIADDRARWEKVYKTIADLEARITALEE